MPERTRNWSLSLASGSSEKGISYPAPTCLGIHESCHTPLGKKRTAMRTGGLFVAEAATAARGRIASSIGSAIAAPAPRRNVLRDKCELRVLMCFIVLG